MVSICGRIAVAATGTVLAITVAPAQAANFQTFNDFNSWKDSVAEFRLVEELFENDIESAISIEFDSGIISTNSVPGFNGYPGLGEVDNRVIAIWDQFTNCVESGGIICSQEWTWKFPNPVMGFGFHIFSADIGRLAIRGDFGNDEQVIPVGETIDPGATDFAVGFLGITAAQPFDTVTFFSRAGNDFVNIDPIGTSNPPVVFALAESVPEPDSMATNIIKNGSFEIGPEPGAFLPLSVGSTDIQDWTVIKGGIDYYGTEWVAADGNRSLDLNGTPGVGGVAQTFSTKEGQRYLVSFDFAGHPSGLLQTMEVAAAGQSESFSFQAGTDLKNIGWETYSWLFTATDTETTLEFSSLQTDYQFGGPALDNVSVTTVSVPEPMTIMGYVVVFSFGGLLKRSQFKKKDLA